MRSTLCSSSSVAESSSIRSSTRASLKNPPLPVTSRTLSEAFGTPLSPLYSGLLSIYASTRSYLHDHQVCHRDLKPENVLVAKSDYCKVSDFGASHEFTAENPFMDLFIGNNSHLLSFNAQSHLYTKERWLTWPQRSSK